MRLILDFKMPKKKKSIPIEEVMVSDNLDQKMHIIEKRVKQEGVPAWKKYKRQIVHEMRGLKID